MARAGDAQPFGDVTFGLLACERQGFAPERNALAELANAGVAKLLFELRLPGKHDLHQFLRGGLQVGQQTNLLKKFRGEVLRFIDHNGAQLLVAEAFNQPAIELYEHARLGPRNRRNAKVSKHEFKKVEHIETRIEDEGRRKAIFDEGTEDGLEQSSFSRANFTRHDDKALACRNAVLQTGKRFPNLRGHV